MKLEKLYYFPLLHKASLREKKKTQKVKNEFSDVATLHFQNYSGCDTLTAKSPWFQPTVAGSAWLRRCQGGHLMAGEAVVDIAGSQAPADPAPPGQGQVFTADVLRGCLF